MRRYKNALYSVSAQFTLVNSDGEAAGAREIGLLLYNGGTVCDDSFDDHAAAAICAELEFSRATRWTSRHRFSIQYNYEITLDDVRCSDDSWENCEFSETHNCGHSEDVFLVCNNGEGKIDFPLCTIHALSLSHSIFLQPLLRQSAMRRLQRNHGSGYRCFDDFHLNVN